MGDVDSIIIKMVKLGPRRRKIAARIRPTLCRKYSSVLILSESHRLPFRKLRQIYNGFNIFFAHFYAR